jgi:hypothetical protein
MPGVRNIRYVLAFFIIVFLYEGFYIFSPSLNYQMNTSAILTLYIYIYPVFRFRVRLSLPNRSVPRLLHLQSPFLLRVVAPAYQRNLGAEFHEPVCYPAGRGHL